MSEDLIEATSTVPTRRRRGRRLLAIGGLAGALVFALPGAAYATSAGTTLQPGESICVGVEANVNAHAIGTATFPGARFRFFANDVLARDSGKGSFGVNWTVNQGAAGYLFCAKNPPGAGTAVTVNLDLTADPS
jgi:hypothetical protein